MTSDNGSPANTARPRPPPQLFREILQASRQELPHNLILSHEFGGGAESYRLKAVRKYLADGKRVVSVSYSTSRDQFRLVYYDGRAAHACFPRPQGLFRFLAQPPFGEILINNLLFYPNLFTMLTYLRRLAEKHGSRLVFPVHDYFALCPTCVLIDDDYKYCGLPSTAVCRKCIPNNDTAMAVVFDSFEMTEWRAHWARFLEACDRIICFSQSSVDLMSQVFPAAIAGRVELIPHDVDYMPARKPALDFAAPLHIGVVGRINGPKGLFLLEEMADLIDRRDSGARLTIVGTVEHADHKSDLRQTGSYRPAELPELLEREGINLLFFPSIWPETFSYVVEELMRLEVPIAAFDIGAPPERLRRYEPSRLIGEISAETALDELIDFHTQLAKTAG